MIGEYSVTLGIIQMTAYEKLVCLHYFGFESGPPKLKVQPPFPVLRALDRKLSLSTLNMVHV